MTARSSFSGGAGNCVNTTSLIMFFLFLSLFVVASVDAAERIMTLDEKIGQMVMVGFRRTALADDHVILRDIRHHHLGGVILFDYDVALNQADRNIRSPEQLKRLVASLQDAATIPLLVAVDQEGGRVVRLKPVHGFAPKPSHAELGRNGDLQATYAAGKNIAATLAEMGINVNFAPVVDLCSNPDNPVIARLDRCFSDQSDSVIRHARQFIQAHQDHGVISVIKHFPGHGSSHGDSHLGFTDVSISWTPAELTPYVDLIGAGRVNALMTAHVFNITLDADHPATLSYPTTTGILREQLGFDGVIFSDDLQMKAITEHYGLDQAVQLALEAGIDILLFGNNLDYDPEIVARVVHIIRDLVATGVICESRIDESYRRIMRLKGVVAR
ncbi:MAG TPA: glycoside hydrolase family 3 protein [Pelovirga sp.]|nr:glycoside hydrolase family 3 protein [Pelovirga sp.]